VLEQFAEIAVERLIERADDAIALITVIARIKVIARITAITLITVITLVMVVVFTEPFVIGRRLRR